MTANCPTPLSLLLCRVINRGIEDPFRLWPDMVSEDERDSDAEQMHDSSELASLVGDIFAADESVNPSQSCLLYTSPSPRDATLSRMPSSA